MYYKPEHNFQSKIGDYDWHSAVTQSCGFITGKWLNEKWISTDFHFTDPKWKYSGINNKLSISVTLCGMHLRFHNFVIKKEHKIVCVLNECTSETEKYSREQKKPALIWGSDRERIARNFHAYCCRNQS